MTPAAHRLGLIGGVRRLAGAVDWLVMLVATTISVTALTIAVLAGAYQIVTRFLTEQPAVVSEYILRACLIWMAFAALPLCIRAGWLVSVDFINKLAGERIAARLSAVSRLVMAAVFGLLLYAGLAILERVKFQTVPVLDVSIQWIYAAIPVGSLLALISLVCALAKPAQPEGRA